jgi:D-3-phosphoglycerate dehydrogenase
MFSRADIVSLHVPALDATREMINDETLAYFKDGAILLNFALC